ncbi:MAG: hypothetical protein ACLP56_09950 [Candidatus Sulfotelmatobacter sp.]
MPFPVIFLMTHFRFGKRLTATLLLVIWQVAAAEQAPSEKERAAADVVAKIVQRTRRQHGLSKLRRISDKHLRELACERAGRGDESATIENGFSADKVGTISYVLYSTSSPDQPSAELLDWVSRKPDEEQLGWEAHRFAVGVCFVRDTKHPEGRYWVGASKYLGAIKSFLLHVCMGIKAKIDGQ